MDAVKFIIELNRMCLYYDGDCKKCPRYGNGCNFSRIQDEAYLKILVADVEKWSKEHPQKTRLTDILEKFPKVEIDNHVYDDSLSYKLESLKQELLRR